MGSIKNDHTIGMDSYFGWVNYYTYDVLDEWSNSRLEEPQEDKVHGGSDDIKNKQAVRFHPDRTRVFFERNMDTNDQYDSKILQDHSFMNVQYGWAWQGQQHENMVIIDMLKCQEKIKKIAKRDKKIKRIKRTKKNKRLIVN